MCIAIICACLPTLRPIVSRLFPNLLPGYTTSYGTHSRHNTSTLNAMNNTRSPTSDTFSEHQLSNLYTVAERNASSEEHKEALKEILVITHITQDSAVTVTRPGSERSTEGIVKDKEYV